MESAAVGGQVDPGPLLGPVSWHAAVQVCRCAGVHVCRCAGDRGGVPIYRRATIPLISLEFPFNCPMCWL